MRIYVQLIQNYFKQEVPTIIISIDKQKYLFNVPTCFQRFIKDHKQRFPKGGNIFFTKASTETLAGLNGFLLTMTAEKLCEDTKLYVSTSLYNYLEEVRYKMGFKILPYSYSNLLSKETRTGILRMEKVYQLLTKQNYLTQVFMNSEEFIHKNFPPEQRNESSKYLNQNNQFNDGEIRIIPFEIQSLGQKIMNYICIPNKLQGKVLPNKIKQLKIPPKLISKLLSEGTLVLQNGQVIMAEQVKEPDSPSPNLLILHYNSIQTIHQVLKNPIFLKYIHNKELVTQSAIHILEDKEDEKILQSKQFRYLINLFPQKAKHIVYSRQYLNKNYDLLREPVSKHLQIVSEVNSYFPNCMPNILGAHYQYIKDQMPKKKFLEELFPGQNFFSYKKLYELVLAPKKNQGYQLSAQEGAPKQKEKKQINFDKLINPIDIEGDVSQLCSVFKQVDPKLVFLGTGSMKPSKYRNVSSIYLEMSKRSSFILDCGEGSYYQLFNHFGYGQIDDIIFKIRTIFITHIHSDHNLGVLDLISQRNKVLRRKYKHQYKTQEQYQKLVWKEKIFLIIPYNVLPWFDSYVSNIDNLLQGCNVLFVQTILNQPLQIIEGTQSKEQNVIKVLKVRTESQKSEMLDENQQQSEVDKCNEANQQSEAYFSPLLQKLLVKYQKNQNNIKLMFYDYLNEENIVNFQPVHVDHCPQSFAIVITHKTGVKISYSGDCRPSKQFAEAARTSTLLIHEATFGDDLINNAIENKHSTVGEAIDMALESKSWKLALTHFSQRYVSAKEIVNPNLYKLSPEKKNYAEKHSIVCFDHLRFNLSELPKLPYQTRKICEIFPSDVGE